MRTNPITMAEKKIAPYGTWSSPISSELVSGGSVSFKEVHVNQTTGQIYLVEGRPTEKGRSAIIEIKGSEVTELLPTEYSATAKIHEYGGGACGMSLDGSIYFTDSNADGVFNLSPSGEVKEILHGDPKLRFADFSVHPLEPHWILAVQEDHRGADVLNTLVAINSQTKTIHPITKGADFYSHPRFSYDGKRVCWMHWNHPDMPWTGSELFVAEWKSGEPVEGKHISGKPKLVSVCQPRWHFDGSLFFEDDRTGFWQLYRYDPLSSDIEHIILGGFEDAEIGAREVYMGSCTYVPLNNNELVIAYTKNAFNGLLLYNFTKKSTVELNLGLVDIQHNALRRVSDTKFAAVGGSATAPTALYLVDVTKPSEKVLLRSSSNIVLDPSIFSKAQAVACPKTHGKDLKGSSNAIFIPPHNPDFEAPSGSKPPLIINIHGGPTSHASAGLHLDAQYYTSRGYAYCYVNHSGSTGYGRRYREELNYSWGLKDCEDTISCIEYLSRKGLIDGSKVGITGGSAGGYTTLQAMVTYPKVFAAGCSLFGIGNLKALADDTHKFESHYLFDLLFPDNTPEEEREKIYRDRSPCFHADKIERPLLMLQGDADKVVPLEQATEMERVMKKNGADVKLVVFEGEGHGFNMQENIKRSIEEEESLWKRTLLV